MIEIQKVLSPRDIADVAALARAIWSEHYTPIIGSEQVEYMLNKYQSRDAIGNQLSAGYEYYMAKEGNQALGYFAIVPDPNEASLMLSKIYVLKTERGRGIGRKIVDFCLRVCGCRKLKSLWLTVNKYNSASIVWYESMGFFNAGEMVQDIGNDFIMDDYKMVKHLA